ncbi:MAG: esterase-like activity of phytase family protein, partial [Deltaproteobacteria bacterium]|nr:esterase-like activity of phytase family protein [Deltaproteobacteria bacterium]
MTRIRNVVGVIAGVCCAFNSALAQNPAPAVRIERLSLGLNDPTCPGTSLSVGSAIALSRMNSADDLTLFALTDRGPNADGPKVAGSDLDSKIFPCPKFVPSFVEVVLRDGTLTAGRRVELSDASGPLNGLPPTSGPSTTDDEIALGPDLRPIVGDARGVDPEGIAISTDAPNDVWVSDEYGPALMRVDARSGRVQERLRPGNELPAIFAQRRANRGFEGLSVLPDGTLVVALQSVFKRSDGEEYPAILLYRYNPKRKNGTVHAYRPAEPVGRLSKVKLGAVACVTEDLCAVIENGVGDGSDLSRLSTFSLRGARDLS